MPLVASCWVGGNRLKASVEAVAPVATVSTPEEPEDDEALPLPLLPPQAASTPAAVTTAAPAAIVRTRQGLNDIGDSFFLSPWGHLGRQYVSGTSRRSARTTAVMPPVNRRDVRLCSSGPCLRQSAIRDLRVD